MAGYSKRSLLEKLGIKEGMGNISIVNAPASFFSVLSTLPDGVNVTTKLTEKHHFIHAFVTEKKILLSLFRKLRSHVLPSGMIWISWPKRQSTIHTDLNENSIRDIGLKNGMVDVKVCAVDDDWSGLKFVFRLKDRV